LFRRSEPERLGDRPTRQEVRDELRRDEEFAEKSRAVRRQIGKALLAVHPAALSKAELLAGGIADTDKILLPMLGLLKNGGLIEELSAGKYRLTERGVEQAKAIAQKEGVASESCSN
jgi:hypothetical protein